MKKFFFLAAALVSSMFAQAQQIVTLGFEEGDASHTTEWALTPGGKFGDWVNVKDGDTWVEQSEDAAHSGQYGLEVLNGDAVSDQQWQRGFKLGHLPIKENTSYRVSFWMKTSEKFKSSISIGREYFDNEMQSPINHTSYNTNWDTTEDEWKHISFVTFTNSKQFLDSIALARYGEADVMIAEDNESVPEEWRGKVIGNGAAGFPENSYFVVINMYNPGAYYLDDIVIEENVAVAGVTYNAECVKIDFGYPTNVADLAKNNGGTYLLDTKYVTIKQGSTDYKVEYLEAHSDGYLYAFLPDGVVLDTESEEPVLVSFAPDADCPIVYTTDKRPSTDIEGTVVALGFENETAYVDESINAISIAWSAPEYVSVTPENNSFNLSADEFKEIVVTFNKEVSIDEASITMSYSDNFGKYEKDIKANAKAEGSTITIAVPEGLEDGDYTFTLTEVGNIMGVPMDMPVIMTYSIGLSTDAEVAETIYASDFANDMTNGVPKGWYTKSVNGEGVDMIHTYGFNDNGSQLNYGWGGNPGGLGARLYEGFSGDFTKALYWCSRDTEIGYASFGELITDYMTADGSVDEASLPDGVEADELSLYLKPGKYNVSFKMAAWKGTPTFKFTVVNLNDLDTPLAQFLDYKATPNMDGKTGKVSGVATYETDFTVETEGYYAMRFEAQAAPWQEYLLADVKVITMPSKAAYYNGLVQEACENAAIVLDECFELEGAETYKALDDAIEEAKGATYHSPSEVNAVIDNLKALSAALQARLDNINEYDNNIQDVKDGIAALEGTKYMNVDVVAEAQQIVALYGDKEGKDLTDAELAEIAPKVSSAAAKLSNVQSCTDILTRGINIALDAAVLLGVDDAAAIEAAENAVSDDREVAKLINDANKIALYKQIVAGTWNAEENLAIVYPHEMKVGKIAVDATEDTEAYEIEDWMNVESDSIVGIDMTGYIANPKFYRVNGVSNAPGWSVDATDEEKTASIGWNGSPSASQYVVDGSVSVYGNVNFNLNQSISGLPVGKYAYVLNARTPLVNTKIADYGKVFYYNAQNDSTQMWDMYLYANIADQTLMTPVNGCSGLDANSVAAVREVTVGEDGVLTIGVVENYTSGVAETHESGEATEGWLGTFYADNASLYFVAPLEGYDYAAALNNLETSISSTQANATIVDIYSVNGVRMAKMQKGVNIVKMSNGKVVKVLVK